tara:strand:- start:760 stop:954 length:195 start_codon:yes stop_codon:yes gene_type:complete
MRVKISKYMSYFNLFIGFLLIIFSFINGLGIVFTLIGAFAVLVSSASIYLKRKVALQSQNDDKK